MKTAILINKFKKPIIYSVLIFVMMIVLSIAAMMGANVESPETPQSIGTIEGDAIVPEHIEKWRPLLEEYTEKYGVEQYTDFLLALMYQELGSSDTLDIMQSSESLGLPPNAIQDPVKSVDAGVSYFKQVLESGQKAGVDFFTIVQAYNFGSGYIGFISINGNRHSLDLAQQFSNEQASKLGWDRYGDPDYVNRVMKNLTGEGEYIETNPLGEWALPVSNPVVTSPYGFRQDPGTGRTQFHQGVDFICDENDSIFSVKQGEVLVAEWNPYGYGNFIVIQHAENEFSAYSHLVVLDVSEGQKVAQGERIGGCGNTGYSFGNHLHFEHRVFYQKAKNLEYFRDPSIILGL
ncbi:lysozyme family protein [Jeotgalibacillus soli]|uniref:lysozyme family protein n=1 Tax=Jeotgalibacillus soli TaxID=889306 RepID=UPI001F188536|nr:lysozyme family protein [Jeotgalibacillus soli]